MLLKIVIAATGADIPVSLIPFVNAEITMVLQLVPVGGGGGGGGGGAVPTVASIVRSQMADHDEV